MFGSELLVWLFVVGWCGSVNFLLVFGFYRNGFFPKIARQKCFLCQVRVFCAVFVFLGFVVAVFFLRVSCWLFSRSSSFSSEKQNQANRSHSPLHVLLVLFLFLFFLPRHRASFCFCIFPGCVSQPCALLGFLDCSEVLLRTVVGRAFGPFFSSLFLFPPVGCLRFFPLFWTADPSSHGHTPGGLTRPSAEGKKLHLDTPMSGVNVVSWVAPFSPHVFFFLSVFFFVFLSLSLSLSLYFSLPLSLFFFSLSLSLSLFFFLLLIVTWPRKIYIYIS